MDKKITAIIIISLVVFLILISFFIFLVLFYKKAMYKNKIVEVLEKNDEITFNELSSKMNEDKIYLLHFLTRYFFFFQDLHLKYEVIGYFDEPENLKFIKKKEEVKEEENIK